MATVETGVAGGVSFALTGEQRELRSLTRAFAEKEIRPRAAECDEHQTHATDIIAKAHEIGLMNLHLLFSAIEGRQLTRQAFLLVAASSEYSECTHSCALRE